MLENGYIKTFRALKRWGWYKDVPTCKLWLHILLSANYEPCMFMGNEIQVGQMVTSYVSLAEGSGLSVQQVRTALAKLKKTGEITVQTNRHYTLITVPKYSEYQQTDNRPSTDNQHTDNTPITDSQQTDNSQVTTMEESKKARKQESKKSSKAATPPSAPAREELVSRFGENLADAIMDWIAYKAEKRDVYKPTGLKSLLTQIENQTSAHGEQAVIDVIRLSMSNGWKGIIWDRIKSQPVDQPQSNNPFWEMLQEEEAREQSRYDANYGNY